MDNFSHDFITEKMQSPNVFHNYYADNIQSKI